MNNEIRKSFQCLYDGMFKGQGAELRHLRHTIWRGIKVMCAGAGRFLVTESTAPRVNLTENRRAYDYFCGFINEAFRRYQIRLLIFPYSILNRHKGTNDEGKMRFLFSCSADLRVRKTKLELVKVLRELLERASPDYKFSVSIVGIDKSEMNESYLLIAWRHRRFD